MRLFQAPLDTCLDSPFFASLSVYGLSAKPKRVSKQTGHQNGKFSDIKQGPRHVGTRFCFGTRLGVSSAAPKGVSKRRGIKWQILYFCEQMGRNYKSPLPGLTPQKMGKFGPKLLKSNFCNFFGSFAPITGVGPGMGNLIIFPHFSGMEASRPL